MDKTFCKTRVQASRSRMTRVLVLATVGTISILASVHATGGIAMAAEQPAAQAMPTKSTGDIVADGVGRDGQLHMAVNKTAVITTKVAYKRVSVGQADIADVNPIGPGNILVTAKKVGSTQLIVWDDSDRSQVIDVIVDFDMQALTDEFKTMFPDSKIEVTTLNGAVALRGRVPNLQTADQAVAMASPYSQKVLNFLEISGGQQVMLQVRIAEVSRTATEQLGVNINYASNAFVGGSNIGQVNPITALPKGLVGTFPQPNGVNLESGTPINSAVTLYGAGQIGNFYLEYFIQALRQNNLLRT